MARKTSTLPTRIWTFGCKPPDAEGQVLARDQLSKAHKYSNRLVEIERNRRKEYREVRLQKIPGLADLEEQTGGLVAELEEARAELKKQHQKAKRRSKAPPELAARISGLVVSVRERRAKLKAARAEVTRQTQEVKEHLAEMLDAQTSVERITALRYLLPTVPANIVEFVVESARIQEDSYQAIRDARATCEVYWGTYLLVEEAAKQASASKVDPHFKAFDGTGRLGVQIQGGLTTSDLFSGKSNLLQIDPLPPGQWETRSGRRHAYSTLRIRVGSTENRAPIWLPFDILVHRELPDGVIKQAWVQVRRIGNHFRYELQLVLEAEAFVERSRGKGIVALDVGWRSLPNGNLRVAYWVDNQGDHGSLELPERVRTGLTLPETLQSFNDLHLDAAKKVLQTWMADKTDLPEWLTEATRHIAHWRQARRLAKVARSFTSEFTPPDFARGLWRNWKQARLSASPKLDLFAPFSEVNRWLEQHGVADETVRVAIYLDMWRRKNAHLLNWSSHQRSKSLGRRKNLYSQWGKWLVETYDTIVLEDFDLRRVGRSVAPESEDPIVRAVHHNRNVAAISEFRLAIEERAAHGAVVRLPSFHTTVTCSSCQHVEGEEDFKSKELVHTCSACKRTWDQDWNAGTNLLLAFTAEPDPGAPLSREPLGGDNSASTARKNPSMASSSTKNDALPLGTGRG